MIPPGRDDPGTVLERTLQLTAIMLLLRPLDVWWITPVVLALAMLVLLFPTVRRSPGTWGALALLLALRIAAVWPLADNHIYLLAYWCLTLALGLAGPAPGPAVGAASRRLLGATFAFAVVWKLVLAPDYLDGRFFHVTLLTDDRFADAVMLLTGLSPADITAARQYLAPLPAGAELAEPGMLPDTLAFSALAIVATSGVLALEAAVALACLLPPAGYAELLQHGAILTFSAVAYAFAPVAGFGWLVVVMGLALCRADQKVLQGAYLASFLLILQYSEVPWAGLIAEWSGLAASR